MTALDTAFHAMNDDPNNDALRMAWFDRLAAAELFLLLEEEPSGDRIKPRVFAVAGGDLVAAFDTEDRLTAFAGEAAFAAMSGRSLAQMLAGGGFGVAVNLGTDAETIVDTDTIVWLASTLSKSPTTVEARPDLVLPPTNLPESLITALDAKLASAEGRATSAYLVATEFEGGRRSHLLAFIDALPEAEASLAQVVQEALTFSGLDAAEMDVGYFSASDEIAARFAQVGLRFDMPQPSAPKPLSAPGSDPKTPPKLR